MGTSSKLTPSRSATGDGVFFFLAFHFHSLPFHPMLTARFKSEVDIMPLIYKLRAWRVLCVDSKLHMSPNCASDTCIRLDSLRNGGKSGKNSQD